MRVWQKWSVSSIQPWSPRFGTGKYRGGIIMSWICYCPCMYTVPIIESSLLFPPLEVCLVRSSFQSCLPFLFLSYFQPIGPFFFLAKRQKASGQYRDTTKTQSWLLLNTRELLLSWRCSHVAISCCWALTCILFILALLHSPTTDNDNIDMNTSILQYQHSGKFRRRLLLDLSCSLGLGTAAGMAWWWVLCLSWGIGMLWFR